MDIIVIGSGLVGSTLLAALRDTGLKIAVLEKELPQALLHNNDQRPLSLSRASHLYLQQLGVWHELAPMAAAIHEVHVSEAGRFGALRFNRRDFNGEVPGYVVPVQSLQKCLYERAAMNPHLQFITSHELLAVSQDDDNITVTYRDQDGEHELTAKLLIAADGANSATRQLLSIATEQEDHQDIAFTAILETAGPHAGVAYERFTDKGVLAILPMWRTQQLRLVWTMDKKLLESIKDEALLLQVSEHFKGRLPKLLKVERTGEYPLKTIIAKQQVKGRALLLGDSAHRVYPLAAQGYNLSLRDTRVLAHLIQKAFRHKDDVGSEELLQQYIKQRQSPQKSVARFTRGLECIFGLQLPLLGHCRAAGLMAVDAIPGLKKLVLEAIGG